MDTKSDWEQWFERIWAYREETIYRRFFGDTGPGIHTIPASLFSQLGRNNPDPRWLFHGVFECPASATRPNWLYVTSALSNPWGIEPGKIEPHAYSGLGFEFMLQTPEKSPWAIPVLHWLMAVQILVASELLKGQLVEWYDRVPLGTSIDPARQSELRNLIVCEPADFLPSFQLESGRVDLMLCVGISDRERDFSATQGGRALVALLKEHEVFPLTDPQRPSVI